MIITLLLGLWLTLLAAGDTPIGRAMRRWTIEAPAARLARVSRGQVALLLLMLLFGAAVIWLFERDGVQLMAMYSPEMLAMLGAFEVTAWLDAAITVVAAAAALRGGSAIAWVRAQVQGRVGSRVSRARRVRRQRPPANDDSDGAAFALAA